MEMYRQTIYCDLDFLKIILSEHNTRICSDNSHYIDIDEEIVTNIRNLLLSSDVKLYLNMSQKDYDDILRDIYKKRKTCEESKLTFFEKKMLDIDMRRHEGLIHLHVNAAKVQLNETLNQDQYLNALFFSCGSKEACTHAMEEYGIIVICAENINDFKYLLFDHGVALRHKEVADWKKCLSTNGVSLPCNSLVLVDNYILNDSASINENLTAIFDALLPKQLNKSLTFHLTIFARLCNDRTYYDSHVRFNHIKEILNKVRPKINFSISIVKCSKDKFHDRTIATNNLYISCGGGFDLFKRGKAQKTTTVCAFHPFLYTHSNWSRKAYSDLLNDASKVLNNTSIYDEVTNINESFSDFIRGEKLNRLLNQILN